MTNEEFQKVLRDTIAKTVDVLGVKALEYSTGGDRLSSFKAAAAIQHCTPEKALLGMWAKHIVSITDMVLSEREYSGAQWDEKLLDCINYTILLRALIKEGMKHGP